MKLFISHSDRGGKTMKKTTILTLVLSLVLSPTVLAGINSKKAAYHGGSTKEKDFPGVTKAIEGNLNTADEKALKFEYTLNSSGKTYSIPYDQFIDVEYGQNAGRRVGAAVATGLLFLPLGVFMLFSKKRKHYVTIGYKDDEGKEQVAVFELGKDIVRTTLPILEARSGKKIEYQDEEAKKSGKGK
jgi:hypothetical protein